MSDRVATGFVPGLPSVDLSFSTLRGNLRIVVFVGLAYYVGCLLGFVFRFPSSGIAYIWPPNAILLTALYISNRNAWPMILGAALVAHGAAHAGDGVPVLSWLWLFLGNAVQAVLAAAIVLRVCRPSSCGETLRAVTVFVLGAAVAAPAMASLLPAAFYVRMGWATDFWTAWGMRTLTNIVTTITLVPPLVAVFGPDRRLWRGLTVSRTAEFIVILLGLFGADLLAGRLAGPSLAGTPPALYACMPFAMWAAARFGIPGLSTCLLAVAY